MTREEELAIIRRVQNGDTQAFEQLVLAHEKEVFNLARRELRNYHDAEDVTSEVFVKVFVNIKKFRGDSQFSTWIHRITLNLCKDKYRSQARHPEVSLVRRDEDDEEDPKEIEVEDVAQSPEVLYEKKLVYEALQDGLRQLSDEHRRILLLREIHGLSYEEIGEKLDLEIGTVKSRIFRARKKLVDYLTKTGNIPDWLASHSTKGGDVR